MTDDYAMRLGWVRLMVNAARESVGFYDKMGWRPFAWDEAELAGSPVPSLQMTKALSHTVSTPGLPGGEP